MNCVYIYRHKATSFHVVLLNKSVNIILLKQLTHTIIVWDCGNVHNHVDDYAGLKEEDEVG
jgi:hypothetical protein